MKEDKFIKENKSLLDDTDAKIIGNVLFASNEPKFVKVQEFSSIKRKAVVSSNEKKKPIYEEETAVAEDGTIMYYAEEVFDDEDDLYSNELKDRLIAKSKYKTYKEMAALIDEALDSRGFSGKVGLDLLAAMNFSHLIRFESEPSEQFVYSFFDMFELDRFIYDADEDVDNIAHLSYIFSIISRARNNPEKPFFLYLKNIRSKDLLNFLRPVYYFIDNPSGENYLTGQGRSVAIPENFFILFSLKEKETVFDISRRLLRYVATLPIDVIETERQNDILGVSLSMTELSRSLNNAMNEIAVSEDGWRKFDGLSNIIGDINGYTMHNKIVRRNEQFLTILLSADIDENVALDLSLSRNIISEAIITARPQDYVEEHDLYRALDENFGSGNAPLTEKVIKSYLSLFDKGGNRIED